MGRVVLAAVAVVIAYMGVTFVQVWRASLQDDDAPAQAIIVLGAAQYDGRPSPALRARLDHAAELYERGRAPVVWVTGGRQPGDRTTEGKSSYDYLRAHGLPDEALAIENQGRSTWESLAATARFLHQQGRTEVLLVSHPYHSYRVAGIAGELGLTAHVSPTKGHPPTPVESARALGRETAAVALGRLVGYRRLTGIDQRLPPGLPRPAMTSGGLATLSP
ncbi:MAG TPA: YdcF family protein [Egibacteraceae bacterium]|nr:YdcF family protein [Egibacteraceae bacterium]